MVSELLKYWTGVALPVRERDEHEGDGTAADYADANALWRRVIKQQSCSAGGTAKREPQSSHPNDAGVALP
jgi:hypothetical protein